MVKYVASDPTPLQPQQPPVIPPVENFLSPLPPTPTIYNYFDPSIPDPSAPNIPDPSVPDISTPNIPDPSVPYPSAPNICVAVHGVVREEDSNMATKNNNSTDAHRKRKWSMKDSTFGRVKT